jgi:plastocyanin
MRRFAFLFPALALFAVSGCATTHEITPQVVQSAVDWNSAAVAEVTLKSFDFDPDRLHLAAGKPLRLALRDVDGGHTFTAPEFFAAARIAPEDAAQVADGEVEMHQGEAVVLRLIPAAGRYKLVCTHTGHAALGMTGEIVVE